MQMNQDDRDRFIRMEEKLDMAVEQMKHHRQDFKTHVSDDFKRFDRVDSKVGWLQKIIYMGLGALALLKIFLKG